MINIPPCSGGDLLSIDCTVTRVNYHFACYLDCFLKWQVNIIPLTWILLGALYNPPNTALYSQPP